MRKSLQLAASYFKVPNSDGMESIVAIVTTVLSHALTMISQGIVSMCL